MPYYVVSKLQRLLNRHGRCLNGAEIFVLGVTYKADVADPRETPALKVMALLQAESASFTYADPHTPSFNVDGRIYKAQEVTREQLNRSECALILTGHTAFDYELIVSQARLVFDTR